MKQKLLLLSLIAIFGFLSAEIRLDFDEKRADFWPLFVFAADEDDSEEEIDEEEVEDTEDDIKKIEKKLEKETAQKNALQGSLNQIQSSLYSTQSAISKTESAITETKNDIERKSQNITSLNNKIEIQKNLIEQIVRRIYYGKKKPLIGMMLSQDGFSRAIGSIDYFVTLNDKVTDLMNGVKDNKEEVEKEKEGLIGTKDEHEKLLALKEAQEKTLTTEKSQTTSALSKKNATISELNSKLSKLKSQLSKLLGKAYDFDDIVDAAKFASKATGVRKDFLLGMLVVESDLGRYTGGCDYKESRMSSYRKGIFKDICKELDYNYKKKKVSCPPASYSGTGGAMGVAQFMPDTWLGYKSRITAATGNSPPDPWSLTDGVAGMAIKLAAGGATKKSGECKAAKLYLSGTTSSKYNWYCDRIAYWADNYESKF